MIKAILSLLPVLFGAIPPESIRELTDKVLDLVEDAAVDSTNKIDDAVVLPICNLIRNAYNIPDNDV